MTSPVKPRANITHVLFDMDGLLLNTEQFYEQVYTEMLAEYGYVFPLSLHAKLQGGKTSTDAEIIVNEFKLPCTPQQWLDAALTRLLQLYPTASLMPGAERFVRHLHNHHIPIAVATGSSNKAFELKTTNHKELFSLFHHIVCAGDDPEVKHGKPAPDPYLVAAKRFQHHNLSSQNILVFEDAINGVASAKAAGMHCIFVPDPRITLPKDIEADEILTKLQDFEPTHWGLPPYE
ncbi:uncharacterized protein [Amphiura filiformis]|uniref:uncharacterized protein isoform X2 n=1 Tax=Amphiura filiformis TaxID=82378 RepID=UPI003B226514